MKFAFDHNLNKDIGWINKALVSQGFIKGQKFNGKEIVGGAEFIGVDSIAILLKSTEGASELFTVFGGGEWVEE